MFRVLRLLSTSTGSQYLKLNPVGNSRTFSQLSLKPSFRNHVALTVPSTNLISRRNFDDSSGGHKNDNYIKSLFEGDSPVSRNGGFEQDYGRTNYGMRNESFSRLGKESFEDSSLSEFPKDFYSKIINGSELSDVEISEFLKANSISMTGDFDISPVMKFSQLNFPDYISDNMEKLAFSKPTPIQSISWPVAFSGKDLVGIAQTGSGKTLSFVLPALIHIEEQQRSFHSGPAVLVVVPTRELAMQCQQVVQKVAGRRIRTACVYGGANRKRQFQAIRNGCQMVIATPGRLLDFVSSRELILRDCTYLVLDEADTMLDMGFERDIRKIVDQIRPDRQFTMWSATWPQNVKRLAQSYLSSSEGHVHIKVGSSELTANVNVKQNFEIIHSKDKARRLTALITQIKDSEPSKVKILIFSNMKRRCEFMSWALQKEGIRSPVYVLHGDKSQAARDECMRGFKNNRDAIMIATDVAGRGLDVSDIDYVINADVPTQCIDYIHRIGRTGRAGKKGQAYSFLCEEDGGIVTDLIENLKNIDHPVDEKLYEMQKWAEGAKFEKYNKKRSYQNDGYRSHRDGQGYGGGSGYRRNDDRRYRPNRYDDDEELYGGHRDNRYGGHRDNRYGSHRDNRYGDNNKYNSERNPRRHADEDLDHLF